jgi:DNA polymerase I-like protein with 3'-5' exonuclease and polymerase domains
LLVYAISGDAAILMKHWALRVEQELAETSYRMLAVVHDEIQGECLDSDVEHVKHILRHAATDAGKALGFRVPIDADAKAGRSWSETH